MGTKGILFLINYIIVINVTAQTAGNLTVSVTTSETGGKFAPKNVMVIWIENSNSEFVKTLLVYANKRKTHLNTWQTSTSNAGSEYNNVDAITGATRTSHGKRSCTWDGTDFNGNLAEDGAYKVLMELTDKNETGNYSSFSFTKGSEKFTLAPDNKPSFSSISIEWIPDEKVRIPNIIESDKIKIYPNPGDGNYFIEGKEIKKVEVRKITGELITLTYKNVIDISQEANGFYVFYIYFKDQTCIKKVLKK